MCVYLGILKSICGYMCVHVHGIFLGVLYKTVLPLRNRTSLGGKLQTFFYTCVYVSLNNHTLIIFIATVIVPSKMPSCLVYTLLTLVMHINKFAVYKK